MSATSHEIDALKSVESLTQKFDVLDTTHRGSIHQQQQQPQVSQQQQQQQQQQPQQQQQQPTSTNCLTSPDTSSNGNNWPMQSTTDSLRISDDDDEEEDESDSGEESDSRWGSECTESDSDAGTDSPDDDSSSFKRKLISMSKWLKDLDTVRQATAFYLLLDNASLPSLALVSNHTKVKQLNELEEFTNANSVCFLQNFLTTHASSSREVVAKLLFNSLPFVDVNRYPPNSSLVLLYLHLVTSTLESLLDPPVDQVKAAELVALSMVVPLFSTEQKDSYIRQYASKIHLASSVNTLPEFKTNSPSFDVSNLPKINPFSGPGMADVPAYLKSLRLHKYTQIFAQLPSLSHFLALNEEQLETLGVAAKGARKKFVQSLQKLRDRPNQLNIVMNSNNPQDVMQVITSVISAPLSIDSPEVNLIMRLLLKLKDQVKGTEHEKELRTIVNNCLKQSCWSRQNLILLVQLIQ